MQGDTTKTNYLPLWKTQFPAYIGSQVKMWSTCRLTARLERVLEFARGMTMTQSQLIDDHVQVSLIAATGHAGLAAGLLTERFGLSQTHAESVLDKGHGLLIAKLGRLEARAAVPLLAALGLHVVIQPCDALPPDALCDVSIRLSDAKYAPKLINTLARLIGVTDLAPTSFSGAEGYVVGSVAPTRAAWLCAALRKLHGVTAVLSDHRAARYDLFAETELTEQEDAAVRNYLRLLGCCSDCEGDAIGCGLDLRMVERVIDRFGELDLFAANQAFQRYDLVVIGRGSLSRQEFIDFLATRPVAQAIPVQKLMDALPLRVETSLTRAASRQFLADYTAIGMQAITRLARHADTVAQNP